MSDNKFRSAIKYSGIAVQMVLIILVFNFIGPKAGTYPSLHNYPFEAIE